jgi:phosphatidylserine decarboxylase
MMSGIFAAWREVPAIVISLLLVIPLLFLTRWRWLVLLPTILLGWVFYFFRDPERIPAVTAAEFILAPADGKVTAIDLVDEPLYLQGPARRISVFMSIFDVHVQRSPYEGQVQFLYYQPGSFAPAFLKDTRSNESNLIGVETPLGRIAVKQIAGILARRIICWVEPGDPVVKGERLGLIRFGSRVDLFLPPEVEVLVSEGQRVTAGQTLLARWR